MFPRSASGWVSTSLHRCSPPTSLGVPGTGPSKDRSVLGGSPMPYTTVHRPPREVSQGHLDCHTPVPAQRRTVMEARSSVWTATVIPELTMILFSGSFSFYQSCTAGRNPILICHFLCCAPPILLPMPSVLQALCFKWPGMPPEPPRRPSMLQQSPASSRAEAPTLL